MNEPPLLTIWEDSPWRVLILRLGLIFALTNASILPFFSLWSFLIFAEILPHGMAQLMALPLLAIAVTGVVLVPVQILLLTVCLTWSVGRFWRRLLTHWVLVGAGGGCCGIGFVIVQVVASVFGGRLGDMHARDNWHTVQGLVGEGMLMAIAVVSGGVLFFYAVQLPFWACRVFGKCRLVQADAQPSQPPPTEGLSIFDLLLTTSFLSVGLAGIQLGVPREQAVVIVASLLGGMVYYGVLSCLFGLPLALLFLSRVRPQVAWGVPFSVAGVGALVISGVALLLSTEWGTMAFYLVGTLFVSSVYIAATGYGLTLLKRAGWELQWGRVAAAVPPRSL